MYPYSVPPDDGL